VLTNRIERPVAVHAAAVALLSRRDIPENVIGDVRELLRALAEFDNRGSRESANTVMDIYRRLTDSRVPAAADFAQVVNTYYNHYNFRAIVSGRLSDLMGRSTRTDSGEVRDFILGADVYGRQTTTAQVSARLLPNPNAASYLLQVDGRTNTTTQSYPRSEEGSVVIFSRSVSRFSARRRVDLDAGGIRAGAPVISVNTSNQVVGATTPLSGVPLLGLIGRSMAVSEAESRRAEMEAIGASRVRDRVLPQFAAESGERITALNDGYQRLVDRLTKRNAFPEILRFSTTTTHLLALGRTARFDELGAYEPLLWLPGDTLAAIQLHESAINNAFGRGELSGDTIDQYTIGRLTAAAEGQPDDAPPEQEESVITLNLADRNPVQVRFQGGMVRLELKAASLQMSEDELPNQIVTVRYRIEPHERTVTVIRHGEIELRPLSDDSGEQESETVAKFRDALELIFLPQFDVGTPGLTNRQGEPMPLRIADLKLWDGWLSLSLR
jgi:hypothetical protein